MLLRYYIGVPVAGYEENNKLLNLVLPGFV